MTTSDSSSYQFSYRQSIAIEARTIAALTMRELHTRFGDNYLGYLWLLGEPALLAMGVAIIHSAFGIPLPWGIQVAPFIISGYTGFYLFRSSCNRACAAILSNRTLLYHRYVSVFDILFSRAIIETFSTMGAAVVLLFLAWIIDCGNLPDRPMRFMEAWMFNAWYCFAVSMLSSAWCTVWETAERLIHPMVYFALPVSGAFTMINNMPPPIRPFVALFPPAQVSEMIREGMFGNFESPWVSVPYMAGFSMFLTVVGIVSIRAVRHKVEL